MIRAGACALVAGLIVACSIGGSQSTSPTPTPPPGTPNVGTLTLTQGACAYDGLHHPRVAGSIEGVRLRDERGAGFNAYVWQLDSGLTYADWAAGFVADPRTVGAHAKNIAHAHVDAFSLTTLMYVTFQAATYGLQCVPLKGGKEQGAGFIAGPIAALPTATDATPVAQGTAPQARGYPALTDMPGSGVLMMGGYTSPPPDYFPEMWTYRPHDAPGPWRKLQVAAPPHVGDAGLICINQCSRLVAVSDPGQAWQFDVGAGTWQKKSAGGHSLHGIRGAYDSESKKVIVFGGDIDLMPIDETWAYDPFADRWTQMHPKTSPPARWFHTMAYDETSDRVVAFGGFALHEKLLGDTWLYDYNHDTWTQAPAGIGPSARGYPQMAYDPIRQRTVLFGGMGVGETPVDDTWLLDANEGRWTELESAWGPGPRAWHAIAYDAAEQSMVMFGGGPSRQYGNDVWLLGSTSSQWTRG